jgi:carbonic anhydrase
VANLIPPYRPDEHNHGTSAAIEFAVKVLNVQHIIILGHSKCSGIKALMDGVEDNYEFIGNWMKIATEAKLKTLKHYSNLSTAEQLRTCGKYHLNIEQVSILQSLERLLEFPWIFEKINEGSLNVHGWYFDFEKGDLLAYKSRSSKFEALAEIDMENSPTSGKKEPDATGDI